MPIRSGSLLALLACAASMLARPAPVGAADLDPLTAAAYERYTAKVEREFTARTGGDFIGETPSRMAQLREGQILSGPGGEDGIMHVTKGLIHHWRATAFVPGVTLAQVLRLAQDYSKYRSVFNYVIGSSTLGHEGDRYRTFLRLKRSAGGLTGVVDLWNVSEYSFPAPDRAESVAKSACIRQVEHAGEDDERRLPDGTGSGYLWRADVLTRYLERDGGVYIEIQTIGLSRGFPPLLGWIIEPIVRRIGRGSAEDTIGQLRRALMSGTTTVDAAPIKGADRWCGE